MVPPYTAQWHAIMAGEDPRCRLRRAGIFLTPGLTRVQWCDGIPKLEPRMARAPVPCSSPPAAAIGTMELLFKSLF